VSLYREQGVVLRTIRPGRGKVRAVAKGVRKTKSRFGARLEPVTNVSLLLYEGRELDIVTQAETIDSFRPIREDLDRLTRATSLLEAVDQVAQEREASPALYRMLVGGLRSLSAADTPVLVPAFFWKLLSLEGFHPMLEECAGCGTPDDLVAFDFTVGGVLCRSCARGARGISSPALALLRQILGGELNRALATPDGPDVHEVDLLATRALEHHLERRLRSVGVLGRA
jgi:DNA repair protein RecO (recombination protein O)